MSSSIPVARTATPSPLPTRLLGQTGAVVTLFGLGGEGVLRTYDRTAEAVRVIHRALEHGVNYYDTAPAYAGSLDYYGAALGERRAEIFLASKTHDRTRDGSLRLLEQSLRRVRTTHLDLWQLHDLRTRHDLARIFGPGGALEALMQARAEGLVRFLGVTGHHDPAILQEAMRRFPFDTALLAVNAADIHRLAFIPTALADAAQRGMGVIGMKIYAQGALLGPDKLTAEEAMGYVLSLPGVSTVVVGCRTPAEVDDNVRLVRQFAAIDGAHRRQLETRTQRYAAVCTAYKKSA
jgi:predicted aldo/keto reductase-like oxidoreductase